MLPLWKSLWSTDSNDHDDDHNNNNKKKREAAEDEEDKIPAASSLKKQRQEDNKDTDDEDHPKVDKEEKDNNDDDDSVFDPDSFDHTQYLQEKKSWLLSARIAGVQEYCGESKCMTLATFWEHELQGREPEHTINMTCGYADSDFQKVVVWKYIDKEEGDSSQDTSGAGAGAGTGGRVTYEAGGCEGGGTPGSKHKIDQKLKAATEWLLRDIPPPPIPRQKLYLRFWPFNVGEPDQWGEFAPYKGGKYHDLNNVGLLEGDWFDDEEGRKTLQQILEVLQKEFLLAVTSEDKKDGE